MPPHTPWVNPIPPQPKQEERRVPERYIFLLLFIVVFARLLKAIRQYRRPQEEFDPDELDVEVTTEREGEPTGGPRYDAGLYWDDLDVTGLSVVATPGGTHHVNGCSRDDAYQAGVSTLQLSRLIPQETPSLPTENLNAHRVQHLLAKLRAASYAAYNEPEGSPGRQIVEMLRRQIAEIMMMHVGRLGLDYASLPPPEIMDPPPAYSDVGQTHENFAEPPPITACPT